MSFKITPKVRPSLVVEYGDQTFELAGRVPAGIMAAANTGTVRKGATVEERKDAEEARGVAIMSLFIDEILPSDADVDLEDIGHIFEAWSSHVGLGESSNSTD